MNTLVIDAPIKILIRIRVQQQGRARFVQRTWDRIRVGAVPGIYELQHPAAGGGNRESRALP